MRPIFSKEPSCVALQADQAGRRPEAAHSERQPMLEVIRTGPNTEYTGRIGQWDNYFKSHKKDRTLLHARGIYVKTDWHSDGARNTPAEPCGIDKRPVKRPRVYCIILYSVTNVY